MRVNYQCAKWIGSIMLFIFILSLVVNRNDSISTHFMIFLILLFLTCTLIVVFCIRRGRA